MSGDERRLVVAREHGLDQGAAKFLVGETVTELEESAVALGRLLAERGEPDPAAYTPVDLFAGVAARKAQRQQALAAALTGRPPQQPRDERGRFTSSFDGGARQPVAQQPPEDHGVWLVRLLRERRADDGAGF